jgi:dethiobiotin synthetase
LAKRIFITATNTDIGKTYTTVRLLEAIASRGVRVGALKPVETGVVTVPPDGSLLLRTLQACNPETAGLTVEDIVPVRMELPAAPFVASGREALTWERIDEALAKMEDLCDVCLIEGAGGLLVPLDASHDMIDLPTRYGAKTLLVSHCRLGCINDTRLSLEALERRGLTSEWVLNCRQSDEDFPVTSQPWFDAVYPKWYRLDRDLEALCDALLL